MECYNLLCSNFAQPFSFDLDNFTTFSHSLLFVNSYVECVVQYSLCHV